MNAIGAMDSYFISNTRLFYRLSLICFLASEDIKQNVRYAPETELRSCVKEEVDVLGSRSLMIVLWSLWTQRDTNNETRDSE